MPKRLPAGIDEQLLRDIANAPGGLSIDDLLRLLRGEISRRSLQRRLSALVDAERLITEGRGRSTRYLLPKAVSKPGAEEDYVRLSPSGAEVRQLARRLQTERTPVGYKRDFLDQYRPNPARFDWEPLSKIDCYRIAAEAILKAH